MNDLQERIKFVNRGLTVYVTHNITKQYHCLLWGTMHQLVTNVIKIHRVVIMPLADMVNIQYTILYS